MFNAESGASCGLHQQLQYKKTSPGLSE